MKTPLTPVNEELKPYEGWHTVYADGCISTNVFEDKGRARDCSPIRKAVYLREVEPPVECKPLRARWAVLIQEGKPRWYCDTEQEARDQTIASGIPEVYRIVEVAEVKSAMDGKAISYPWALLDHEDRLCDRFSSREEAIKAARKRRSIYNLYQFRVAKLVEEE